MWHLAWAFTWLAGLPVSALRAAHRPWHTIPCKSSTCSDPDAAAAFRIAGLPVQPFASAPDLTSSTGQLTADLLQRDQGSALRHVPPLTLASALQSAG